MLPSVSVVMAAFDAEQFVGEAIESALAQDYPGELVEVVVVDDGSTDATAAIARHHAESSGRVRVIGRANGGNVAATNTGFAHAHGDVVALLDADDAWPRDRLRSAVDVLVDRPGVGLVYGDMTVIDEDGEVLQQSWLAGDVTPEGRCLGAQLAGNNITASSIVMRGAVLRAVAPIPAGMPWADWWLATRVAQVADIAYLAEPRTLYRFHGANMSLGAQGDARRGELVKAAGFQRHLLRTLRPGDATPAEIVAGWAAFERNVREATALAATPFRRASTSATPTAPRRSRSSARRSRRWPRARRRRRSGPCSAPRPPTRGTTRRATVSRPRSRGPDAGSHARRRPRAAAGPGPTAPPPDLNAIPTHRAPRLERRGRSSPRSEEEPCRR